MSDVDLVALGSGMSFFVLAVVYFGGQALVQRLRRKEQERRAARFEARKRRTSTKVSRDEAK
jgi:hypothetical protein